MTDPDPPRGRPEDDPPSWAPFGPSSDDDLEAPAPPIPPPPPAGAEASAPGGELGEQEGARPEAAAPREAAPAAGALWSGEDPVTSGPPAPERPDGPAPERPDPPAPERPDPPAFQPPTAPAIGGPGRLTPGDPLGGGAPPPPPPPAPPPPDAARPAAWPPPHIAPAALQRRTPGNATAALVLGVLGLIVCPIVCSVAAIALGRIAIRQIDGNPRLNGRGMAQTGLVLGVIGLVVYGFAVLLLILGSATALRT